MTILISAVMDLDPAHAEQIIRDAKPLIDGALAESGCKAYAWTLDPSIPGRVHVFEEWVDEASLAAHFSSTPYLGMRQHLRRAGPIKSSSRKYQISKSEPVYDTNGNPHADFSISSGGV